MTKDFFERHYAMLSDYADALKSSAMPSSRKSPRWGTSGASWKATRAQPASTQSRTGLGFALRRSRRRRLPVGDSKTGWGRSNPASEWWPTSGADNRIAKQGGGAAFLTITLSTTLLVLLLISIKPLI